MGAQTSKRLALRETARIGVTHLAELAPIAGVNPKQWLTTKLTSESLVVSLRARHEVGEAINTSQ